MRRLFVAFFFLIIAGGIFYIAPNYQVTTFYDKDEIRIVIDDKEITKKLSNPVLIDDGVVMLSVDTIDIYFDKWLYYDEKYDTYITTTDTSVAKFKVNSNILEIDGVSKEMKTAPKVFVFEEIVDDEVVKIKPQQHMDTRAVVYVPIEELEEFYNINVVYNDKVVITKINPEMQTIVIKDEKIKLRALKTFWSRKTAMVEVGEKINIYRYSAEKEWIWARTEDGKLGYVSAKDIASYGLKNYVKPEEENIEKINLVWEYAENYTPNRSGQKKIENIDVVSPTWIYLKDTDGNLRTTIDKKYISWAHGQGYKIWAVLKNDGMGIDNTSKVVTDMKVRENLIKQLLEICEENELDGINIDFENMKKEDVNEFSQFVREISSSLRKNGYVVSVDVTVPDGSDTWSLCYNRIELADATDYIVLMAYDQYGQESKKAGSVASYEWVENNLKKMIERDEIDSNKIILGIPLYSRVWYVNDGTVKSTSTLYMTGLEKYLNSSKTVWLEEDKQFYYKSVSGDTWTVMWMDEKESIKEKLSLIKKYDLAGSAYWRWGFETETFWNDINEYINY